MLSFRKWWKGLRRRSNSTEHYRPGFDELGGLSSNRLRQAAPSDRPQLEQLEERIVLDFATGAITAVSTSQGTGVSVLASDPTQVGAGGADVWLNIAGSWHQISSGNLYTTITAGAPTTGYALDTSGKVWQLQGESGLIQIANPGNTQFRAISGGVNDTVFAIDATGNAWSHSGSGWHQLTSGVTVLQISDGTTNSGNNNLLFAVGSDNNPWAYLRSDNPGAPNGGWLQLATGGVVSQVRGGTEPSVWAITTSGSVFELTLHHTWQQAWGSNTNGGAADNVSLVSFNGTDLALITDSQENLWLGAPGSSPVLESGSCQCVGDIAGDQAGHIYAATSDEIHSVTPNDLWTSPIFGGGWNQMTSGSALFEPSDSDVY